MPKKIVISILISILLFTYSLLPIFTPLAHAQDTSWYNQTYEEWLAKVFDEDTPDEIFGERYTYAQVQWVIYSLAAFLSSAGLQDVVSCLAENDGDLGSCIPEIEGLLRNIGLLSMDYSGGNLAQTKGVLLASFTQRPISSISYFKDLANRLRIIPEAKAQGFGFGAADPVLNLWRMVRNATYFLLILVVVAMAFMIMFRVKISPQAVITVQSALPKVILALILITFSYAIAGLLIDLMYVVIGILATIISQSDVVAGDYKNWAKMFEALTERSIITVLIQYFIVFCISLYASLFMSGAGTALLTGVITVIFPIILIIIVILVAIVLLIAMLKIMWLLIKTYAMILLQIVAAPIIILLGTLGPGGFGLWLKNILAQLAVYPAVGFMFVLSFVFLRGALHNYEGVLGTPIMNALFPFGVGPSLGASAWGPPFTFGASQIDLLWLGVSLVILLLIPKISDIIKSFIQGRPFAYGTAIGEPFAMFWGSTMGKELRERAAGGMLSRPGIYERAGGLMTVVRAPGRLGSYQARIGSRVAGYGQQLSERKASQEKTKAEIK